MSMSEFFFFCLLPTQYTQGEINYFMHVHTIQLKSKLYLQLNTGWNTNDIWDCNRMVMGPILHGTGWWYWPEALLVVFCSRCWWYEHRMKNRYLQVGIQFRVSEWLLFSNISANIHLYYGKKKLIENEMILDQHANLDCYSASSLKQQPGGRHVAPLGHIILIPSQSIFLLSTACLAKKQQYQFNSLWFDPTSARPHDLPHTSGAR